MSKALASDRKIAEEIIETLDTDEMVLLVRGLFAELQHDDNFISTVKDVVISILDDYINPTKRDKALYKLAQSL